MSETERQPDLRNIALTIEATQAAERVQDVLGLASRLDAVRLGITYAIRNRVTLDRDGGWTPGGTNYNVATVDTADSTFKRLVPIFYDDPAALLQPYRCLETLMSKGLVLLRAHIDDGTVLALGDLRELPE